MTNVSLIKCSSYNKDSVFKAVEESISLLGGIEKFIKKGERILLKPNLLSPKTPDEHITTHPEVVRAVIKLVKRAGAKPYVGDSPGGCVLSSNNNKRMLANIDLHWTKTGMKQICREEGVELICLEADGVETFDFPDRKCIMEITISKQVLSFDGIINIPKLKTHSLVLFTGAIKNLFGCIPGFRKAKYHIHAVNPIHFSQFLVDILSIIKPRLNVVDGIMGMDGNGPSAGRIKHFDAVIAGSDAVAVDLIGSMVIGFKPADIPQIKIANKQGIGTGDLSKINILGERINDMIQKDFLKPSNSMATHVPQFVATLLNRFIWAHPEMNTSKCTVCSMCIKSCPANAIKLHNSFPVVDRKKCINCMCCNEICEAHAIEIKLSPLANLVIK